MTDKNQVIITVRFPAWEQDGHKFSAFGIKYLFTMPLIPFPDWKEDDERWFDYNEDKIVAATFKKAYEATMKQDFNGEILFIENASLVSMKSDEVVES